MNKDINPNNVMNSPMAKYAKCVSLNTSGEMWDELIPNVLRETHLAYLAIGLFMTLFGLISLFIKDKLFMSEALVATAFGVFISYAQLFEPTKQFGDSLDKSTLEFTRIVLGIQCIAAGIATPGNYIKQEWKSLSMLLGPVMISMWLISSLGIYLIMGLSWIDSLVIAACITPTDPVLANSIVHGRFADAYIPLHVRLLLSAESAMNDGLGTPMLLLPLYLSRIDNVGEAIGSFIYKVILYQVALSIAVGILVGVAARYALKYCEKNGLIDKESLLSFSVSLALALTGSLATLGSDDILSCFIAGTILTWDSWFNKLVEESRIQEVLDNILNLLYFIFLGSRVRFVNFSEFFPIYKLFLLSIWILFLRRLPSIMILKNWIPALKSRKEAFFCGWFGPIGAGAIFYSMIAIVYLDVDPGPIFSIVIFIVLSSIVVHGGTVSLFHFGLSRHATWKSERSRRETENVEYLTESQQTDITVLAIDAGTRNNSEEVPGIVKEYHIPDQEISSVDVDIRINQTDGKIL